MSSFSRQTGELRMRLAMSCSLLPICFSSQAM